MFKKMLIVLGLGFFSGLPIALCIGNLQAWYKTSNLDIVTICSLSLIGQPYAYKFLWAPLLDRFVPNRFGRRRGWLLPIQIATTAAIFWISNLSPENCPKLLAYSAMLLAFLSASQDIVIDAYRTEFLTNEKEQSLGAALAVEGYRIAMLTSGAFALYLAHHYGWKFSYRAMGCLMSLSIFLTLYAPEPTMIKIEKVNIFVSISNAIASFLKRDYAIGFLLLICIYKLGDAFSHTALTAFLLDLGFNLSEIALINKIILLVSTLIGVALGGIIIPKLGLLRALCIFAVLQATSNLLYMVIAITGKNMLITGLGFFLENLCSGMGSAAFSMLIMKLCDVQFTAFQFALFTSITALGRTYVGPIAGNIIKTVGWADYYIFTAIVSLLPLIVLFILRQAITGIDKEKERVAKLMSHDQSKISDPEQYIENTGKARA